MPLVRYFAYIGSLLLALLFIADWCFPSLNAEAARSDVDRPIIRIHSSHRWPEAVVIDTTLPTIVPPPAAVAVDTPAANPAREAFAMATELTPLVKAAEPVKVAKPRKDPAPSRRPARRL